MIRAACLEGSFGMNSAAWLTRTIVVCLSLGLGLGLELGLVGCAGSLQMTVVHMNDTHSHIDSGSMTLDIDDVRVRVPAGGLARASTRIDDVRDMDENVIFLHAGDAVQGTLYFTRYHGKPEIAWLNWMACDAMVTGNHEYDKGAKVLSQLVEMADFPILAANVDTSSDPYLSGRLAPYTLLDVDGYPVAVIGLVTPDTPDTSNPEETIVFNDTIPAAQRWVRELTDRGIDRIVVLSHTGYERDCELAAAVDGIDVVIGGHTHTVLGAPDQIITAVEGPYPTRITGPSGHPVYVVQAGCHAANVGVLHVVFDRRGRVTECHGAAPFLIGDAYQCKDETGQYTAVDTAAVERINQRVEAAGMLVRVPEDGEIAERFRSYREGIDAMKQQEIASIPRDLPHVRLPGMRDSITGEILVHGSELAPVVAEAWFWKAMQIGLNPDFAVQNAGGVRMNLSSGPLTVGSLIEILPFENTLFVLDVSGAEWVALMESLMQRIEKADNDGSFPYASRLRYSVDMNRPVGHRIVSMEHLDATGTWRAIDSGRTYRIATNAYIAAGRDGYFIFGEATGYRYDTGFGDADVFMEYIQSGVNPDLSLPVGLSFLPMNKAMHP
ncbi:bifunctional metallophosphatase/5'-nucleotidase [bacterium]|nr:bifunctional metallophosphatase/5'-nucleotidase [candidate division CSSED10-310 bacterium]